MIAIIAIANASNKAIPFCNPREALKSLTANLLRKQPFSQLPAGNNAKQLKRGFARTVSSSSQERDNVRDDHLEIRRFRECDFTWSRAFTAFEEQRNHGCS